MKRQKYMTLKDEVSQLVCAQYANGEERRNRSKRKKEVESKCKKAQLWMCLVVKVKSDDVKNNIA